MFAAAGAMADVGKFAKSPVLTPFLPRFAPLENAEKDDKKREKPKKAGKTGRARQKNHAMRPRNKLATVNFRRVNLGG